MFDRDYDVVILGTGLKQAILSCALSSQGLKILHLEKSVFIPTSQIVDQFKFIVDPFPKFILNYGLYFCLK
jgi:choline dehydrogenase-like flavoprotein